MSTDEIFTVCIAAVIIVFFICDVAHDYLRSKFGETVEDEDV